MIVRHSSGVSSVALPRRRFSNGVPLARRGRGGISGGSSTYPCSPAHARKRRSVDSSFFTVARFTLPSRCRWYVAHWGRVISATTRKNGTMCVVPCSS